MESRGAASLGEKIVQTVDGHRDSASGDARAFLECMAASLDVLCVNGSLANVMCLDCGVEVHEGGADMPESVATVESARGGMVCRRTSNIVHRFVEKRHGNYCRTANRIGERMVRDWLAGSRSGRHYDTCIVHLAGMVKTVAFHGHRRSL